MRFFAVCLTLAALAGLGGCSSSPMSPSSARSDGSPAPASFAQFSDLPVPAKATMDVDHTLLLGNGENWVGRLVYTSWNSPSNMYDFYRSDMPGFGWQEVTSVRASISVLTWQRGERIATIQIRETTFGSEVIVTMSPAHGAGSSSSFSGSGGGYQPPPPSAAPSSRVTKEPLK